MIKSTVAILTVILIILFCRKIRIRRWLLEYEFLSDKHCYYLSELDKRTCYLVRHGGNILDDELIQYYGIKTDEAWVELNAFIQSMPPKLKNKFDLQSNK